MIGYFPTPYVNESLYSIIARYSHHKGGVSKYKTFKELLDPSNIKIKWGIVNNIENFTKNIEHFSKDYTPSYFLKNHTNMPLYSPFNKALSMADGINNIKSKKYQTRGESDVPRKEQLYYCTDCLKEQFKKHKEGYWNRIFQVPGVLVCTRHKRMLNKYEINIIRENLNRLIIPDYNLISIPETRVNPNTLSSLLDITQNVEYFFNQDVENIDFSKLYSTYIEFIKTKGISLPISNMKNKLSDLLISKFDGIALNFLNSNPKHNRWINEYFTGKGIERLHPLRHILLMMLLAGSVKNFLNETPLFIPFGEGPWICMNPLSDHYLEKVITNIEVKIHHGTRDYYAEFQCSCGYVYRLNNGELNPLKVRYFSNRIMKKGHVWEREFRKLLNSGFSITKIAEITNLSRPTIRKIINEGPDPIVNGIRKKQETCIITRKQKTENYKKIWRKIVQNNPDLSRGQLANLNRAAYAWLYQFDKEWIENNLPSSRIGTTRKTFESYQKSDLELLKRLKNLTRNWEVYEKNKGKLIRKSINAIYQILGVRNNLYINKEHFPLSLNFVKSIEESIADFQIRKIKDTLNTKLQGKKVTKFLLLEVAGVRKSFKKENEKIIEQIIENHNKLF